MGLVARRCRQTARHHISLEVKLSTLLWAPWPGFSLQGTWWWGCSQSMILNELPSLIISRCQIQLKKTDRESKDGRQFGLLSLGSLGRWSHPSPTSHLCPAITACLPQDRHPSYKPKVWINWGQFCHLPGKVGPMAKSHSSRSWLMGRQCSPGQIMPIIWEKGSHVALVPIVHAAGEA